jgi:hypothetical protein
MTETAMQIHADGTAEIYRRGRQYLRVFGDDGEPRWLKRTSRGLRPVSDRRARRLERVYRNPTTKPFARFPRLALDPQVGQPAFHMAFGYGTVTAIEGDQITLVCKSEGDVTHKVKAPDLITKNKAEVEFGTCYFAGGAKSWRRAAGRWASVYKNLCLMEGKGAYGDWLKRLNLNRSSIDDLIRRFEDEERRFSQPQLVLPESGKTASSNSESEMEISPYLVTGSPQTSESTPDPVNDERQQNIQVEISKREGMKPTYHKNILFLQHRHVDPKKLALFNAIREKAKKSVDAIMQRKIDEGIEEVLALPATVQLNGKSPRSRRGKKASMKPQKKRRAK